MSLILNAEAQDHSSLLSPSLSDNSSASSSVLESSQSFTATSNPRLLFVQTLIKAPLNRLYTYYQSMTTETRPDVTVQVPTEATASFAHETPRHDKPLPTSEAPAVPSRRLHPQAEDYRSSLMAGTASVILKKEDGGSAGVEFGDLPVGVVIHIAAHLDVRSLCHLQQTCRRMYSLTSDELLWRRKLWEDSRQWEVVSHLSHPKVYQEVSSDRSAQEM